MPSGIREELEDLSAILLRQHVAVTTDSWTDVANRTHTGYTWTLINDEWQLLAFSPHCSLAQGSSRGEDLARESKGFIRKHKLDGRVVALVSDCEPSMICSGRQLREEGVTQHYGCAAHRMESTAGKFFTGEATAKCLNRCRKTVTRFTGSSQAQSRLMRYCEAQEPQVAQLAVIQDVATRWSTHDMAERLTLLGPAVRAMELAESTKPARKPLDWEILPGIVEILKPSKKLQIVLEGSTYVTCSLLIGLISDLRVKLEEVVDKCEADPEDVQQSLVALQGKQALFPVAKAVLADFNARWGKDVDIGTFVQGHRNQPQGFKSHQVLAALLDPRLKNAMPGIPNDEHEGLRSLLVTEAAKAELEEQESKRTQDAGAVPVLDDSDSSSPDAPSETGPPTVVVPQKVQDERNVCQLLRGSE